MKIIIIIITNDTLLWCWGNYSTLMQVLNDKFLMQTKEVTETSIYLHFCLSEIRNVSLQVL